MVLVVLENNYYYNLTEIAGNISVSHVSWNTHTDHSSLRQSVLDTALRILTTGSQHSTGVSAHFIETS